jgi:hypothetical protein
MKLNSFDTVARVRQYRAVSPEDRALNAHGTFSIERAVGLDPQTARSHAVDFGNSNKLSPGQSRGRQCDGELRRLQGGSGSPPAIHVVNEVTA